MTATIVKPVWTVDGWTGNAVDDAGVTWFVRRDSGWFGPVGVRTSSTDRPAGDGTYTGRNLRASRVVVLEGFFQAPTTQTADDALDRFNSLLGDGELYELSVEENHRTLTAAVRLGDGTNIERVSPRRCEFQLSLIAPDPRKYGADRDVTTGLATAASGGVLWNGTAGATGVEWNGPAGATGVRWQSGSGTSGIVTVTNDGNTVAPVVLTFTAGSSGLVDPAVTDVAGNAVISYGGTIPAGSTLVIDTDSMSVLLDGANRGPLLTRADPITVPRQGSAQLLFTATSGPTASLLARVRDTYV